MQINKPQRPVLVALAACTRPREEWATTDQVMAVLRDADPAATTLTMAGLKARLNSLSRKGAAERKPGAQDPGYVWFRVTQAGSDYLARQLVPRRSNDGR
jgi:hypothetical protein